VIGYKFYCSQC